MNGTIVKTLLLVLLILYMGFIPTKSSCQNSPHLVYGNLYNSDNSVPADGDIQFTAYITTRAEEKLYHNSLGCGYESGVMFVQCGNFTTQWSGGDILHADITNISNGESGTWNVALNSTPPTVVNDTSLPVELSLFEANLLEDCVLLKWRTESEVENAGFNIFRSLENNKDRKKINAALINGSGNSSHANEYSYKDKNVKNGITYSYELESKDYNGVSTFFGPISIKVELIQIEIPTNFQLEQNYPNPFNPVTTIEYQLPKDTYISLRIFNIIGELVRTLKDERQSAGYYKIQWNGRDENGKAVSGGLYLYHLKADGFLQSNKMVLIR